MSRRRNNHLRLPLHQVDLGAPVRNRLRWIPPIPHNVHGEPLKQPLLGWLMKHAPGGSSSMRQLIVVDRENRSSNWCHSCFGRQPQHLLRSGPHLAEQCINLKSVRMKNGLHQEGPLHRSHHMRASANQRPFDSRSSHATLPYVGANTVLKHGPCNRPAA